MTIAFRGPMTLYNIAVYQPTNSSSASWKQVSSWAAGEKPTNLVFMNNDGGDVSGEWSSMYFPPVKAIARTNISFVVCAGASQSYANGDWTAAAASANAEVASGNLGEGYEVVRPPSLRTSLELLTRPYLPRTS